MLVVSDVDDVYLPQPNDLLVNLNEARASLEGLLGRLNTMFAENLSVGSALGAALQAAFKMMVSTALSVCIQVTNFVFRSLRVVGRSASFLLAFQAWAPVRSRTGRIPSPSAPPRFAAFSPFFVPFMILLQESALLQAASPFYKTFAIECSRTQVSVDMFLFSAQYQDVATLGT
jgi:protein transport protein SEC24